MTAVWPHCVRSRARLNPAPTRHSGRTATSPRNPAARAMVAMAIRIENPRGWPATTEANPGPPSVDPPNDPATEENEEKNSFAGSTTNTTLASQTHPRPIRRSATAVRLRSAPARGDDSTPSLVRDPLLRAGPNRADG